MRNASGHQGENEWQSKKKINKNTYYISSIKRVTRNHVEVGQNNGKETSKKNVLARAKLLFCLLDLLLFFNRSRCLRRLALHDSIFCLSKL